MAAAVRVRTPSFGVDVLEVPSHRRRDQEDLGDLWVRLAPRDPSEDLALARRQAEPLPESSSSSMSLERSTVRRRPASRRVSVSEPDSSHFASAGGSSLASGMLAVRNGHFERRERSQSACK